MGYSTSEKQNEKICHARVWGSIFKPEAKMAEVVKDIGGDLVLIGLDLELIYKASRVDKKSPLHLLLYQTTGNYGFYPIHRR
jgi:hypothetical protein